MLVARGGLGQPLRRSSRRASRSEPKQEGQVCAGRSEFVPHQAEQQDGVGIPVEDRIEPAAKLAPGMFQPGDLTIAAVDDRGHLRQHAPP